MKLVVKVDKTDTYLLELKQHGSNVLLKVRDALGQPITCGNMLEILPSGQIRLCECFEAPGFKTTDRKVQVID